MNPFDGVQTSQMQLPVQFSTSGVTTNLDAISFGTSPEHIVQTMPTYAGVGWGNSGGGSSFVQNADIVDTITDMGGQTCVTIFPKALLSSITHDARLL